MSFWTELRPPTQCEALIAVTQCGWLSQYAQKVGSLDSVFTIMAGYFALTGQIVTAAGGKLIKTLGDDALVVFPAAVVDDGIMALRRVRHDGREWFVRQGYDSRVIVKLDFGPVVLGCVGSPGEEHLDVFGKPVAGAFMLASTGFALTPAVFRSLSPEVRALVPQGE